MPKISPEKLKNVELIVYQLGEVKNLLGNMDVKFDAYKEATDKRLLELERFQAGIVAQPKIDVQKIILAAFSLISTVIAVALGINQNK